MITILTDAWTALINGASLVLIWTAVGVIFLIGDMILPGVFLLFLGIAALATAGILWVFPLTLWSAMIVFSVACVLLLALFGRMYRDFVRRRPDHTINQKAHLLGQEPFMLTEAIVHGRSRASLGGSIWTLHGPDAPKGTWVVVRKVEGNTLHVDLVDPGDASCP